MTTQTNPDRRINLSLARPGQVIRHRGSWATVVRQLPPSILGRVAVRVEVDGELETIFADSCALVTLLKG